MSSMEHEFKIGIGIKELLGKSYEDQLAFLKPIFGNELEIDYFDNKIEFISLDTKKWQFRYDVLFYVIDKSNSSLYSDISLKELNDKIKFIEEKLGIELSPKNIKIFSASWYNGVDEPILYFTEKWKKEIEKGEDDD